MNRSLAIACLSCLISLAAFAEEKADLKKGTPIDLTDYVNHTPGEKIEADRREGNTLSLPLGEQTFEGIRMKIEEKVVQLGSSVMKERPEKVSGIKIGRKLSRLHILHATCFGGGPNRPGAAWYVEDDTAIGEYRINYEDGSSENILIEYGKDVRDWWFREDEKETSRSKVVWKGANDLAEKYDCLLRLYLTTWKNPKPDQKVVSVDYIGRKDETVAAPFCVAMTIEEK